MKNREQAGMLEIGHNEQNQIVINLPRDMTGHIVFSVEQARALATILLKRCDLIDPTHAGLPELHEFFTPCIDNPEQGMDVVSAEEVAALRAFALAWYQRALEFRSSADICVNRAAMRELLIAVLGPEHYIRELQATRGIGRNCIDVLVDQFNSFVNTPDAKRAPLDISALKLCSIIRNRGSGWVYEVISIKGRYPIVQRLLDISNPDEWEEVVSNG